MIGKAIHAVKEPNPHFWFFALPAINLTIFLILAIVGTDHFRPKPSWYGDNSLYWQFRYLVKVSFGSGGLGLWVFYAEALLVTPLLAGWQIAGERRKGNLQASLATYISPAHYLYKQTLAATSPVVFMLILAMPFAALVYATGEDARITDVWNMTRFALMLVTPAVLLTIAFGTAFTMISALSANPAVSTGLSYLIVLLLNGVCYATHPPHYGGLFGLLDPLLAWIFFIYDGHRTTMVMFHTLIGVSIALFLIVVLTYFAVRRLEREWDSPSPGTSQSLES